MSGKKFECIEGCAQCCVEREYYPSARFGKIGVLIMPDEKKKIEELARGEGLQVTILPRIGTSDSPDGPEHILAYQMMGIEKNGNTCPFLDKDSESPHGGYACKIYDQRPLACRAYPVIGSAPTILDPKCKFCQECGTASSNLDSELEALARIKGRTNTDRPRIWRYATGVGDEASGKGWILES